jgi:O-antigen ligase
MWIETRGHPLIIHNSYVWVLAEMGLLGAGLIFTKPLMWGWTLLKAHVKQYRQKEVFPFGQILFFALLVIFALFALPQDVFYQRLFWFWFGLSSAVYFPTLTLRKNT